MFKKFITEQSGSVPTVIGKSAIFTGSIYSECDVRIEGAVEGSIHTVGCVVVSEWGRIAGDITAECVTISGEVVGNVNAKRSIVITGTGKVFGNISGAQTVTEIGALVRGKVDLDIVSNRVQSVG